MFAQKTSLGVVGFGRGPFPPPDGGGRATAFAVAPTPTFGMDEGGGATVAGCSGGAGVRRRSGAATAFAEDTGEGEVSAAGLRSGTMYSRNGSGSRLPIASETAPTAKAKGQRDSLSSRGIVFSSNSLPVIVISPIGVGGATGGGGASGCGATIWPGTGRAVCDGSSLKSRADPPRAVDGRSSLIESGERGGVGEGGAAGGPLRAAAIAAFAGLAG